MSRTRRRYVQFWRDYIRANRDNWQLLLAEYERIRHAWACLVALEGSTADREQWILDYLLGLDTFLEQRGLYPQNIAWIERGIEAAKTQGRWQLTGRFYQDIGWCYRSLGDTQQAQQYLQTSLELRQKFGPPIGEAATLNMLGALYTDLNQFELALDYLQRALALRQETGHHEGEGITRHNIATIYTEQGKWLEAAEQYQAALQIARDTDDKYSEAGTLNNLAEVDLVLGHTEQAEQLLREALALFVVAGDEVHQATALGNLGMLLKERGEIDEAMAMYEQALTIGRRFGRFAQLGTILNNMGLFMRVLVNTAVPLNTLKKPTSCTSKRGGLSIKPLPW